MAAAAPGLTPGQRQHLMITVQPGSMIGLDGRPLVGAQVGISLVPPELVRDMLPPGLSERQRFVRFAELFEHFSNTGELDPAPDVRFAPR